MEFGFQRGEFLVKGRAVEAGAVRVVRAGQGGEAGAAGKGPDRAVGQGEGVARAVHAADHQAMRIKDAQPFFVQGAHGRGQGAPVQTVPDLIQIVARAVDKDGAAILGQGGQPAPEVGPFNIGMMAEIAGAAVGGTVFAAQAGGGGCFAVGLVHARVQIGQASVEAWGCGGAFVLGFFCHGEESGGRSDRPGEPGREHARVFRGRGMPAVHGKVGGRFIQAGPLFIQILYGLARVHGHAALGLSGKALENDRQGHVNVDDRPQGPQVPHRVLPVYGAAAGGDDAALDVDAADHFAFEIQEGFLVELVGDLLQARAVCGLDHVVRVDLGPAHNGGQFAPDSGFARGRHADDADAALGGKPVRMGSECGAVHAVL